MNRYSYWTQWLRALFAGHYRRVAEQYHALGQKRDLLADIATRGGVYDPAPTDADVLALARHEGRRSLALEILQLAQADPREIESYVKSVIRNQSEKEPRHG